MTTIFLDIMNRSISAGWLILAVAVLFTDNIFQSERINSPFVMGMVKPRIYVPFALEGEDLDCVIAHEKAHIARLDYLLKPIAFLILTVYWFHPLVWLAYILLCRDIEYACDEKVLGKLDIQQKKAYSRALLQCSMGQKHGGRLIAACPVAFGEIGVKSRIRSVLHYKKPGFWVLSVSLLACAVCCVCFMTEPKQEEEKGAADSELMRPIAVESEIAGPVIGGEESTDVMKDAMGTDTAEGSVYIQPGEGAVVSAPPAMMIQDVYGIVEDSFAVLSETYALHCKGASDTAAEGLIPVAAGVDNDRKYATAAVKGAEWSEERLGENDFYGTATYIFATDNYMEKAELVWHDVAYTYDMSEVWIPEEQIASIRVTQGWTGQEKTFGVTDSSHGYKDILDSYYQLNVMPKEALEQRIGYQYCMRLDALDWGENG